MTKVRSAAFDKDWPMFKRVGWAAVIAAIAFLIWQTTAAEPLWPHAISAVLLVIIGSMAGLRLGTESAEAYTRDLQRLNKVLDEQNRELAKANAILLKELTSEMQPSKSA